MAQPGNFTPILLYGSSTPTNVPLAANLTNSATGSEIAINVADKNLFFKDSGGVVNTVPIRQSSTSSNGWLSSTDWNTFNNKAPAGAYLTAVTADSPLSGAGTSASHLVIAQANTSTSGYLSSTDWSTFNGKQAALVSGTNIKTVGGVTLLGSGDVGTIGVGYGGTGLTTLTASYIPYGNGTSAFASSSNLTFNGSQLSVGGLTSSNQFETQSGSTGGVFLFRYASNASSRSWKINNDVLAYGDFAIQQSTTQTGSTYAQLLYISPSGGVSIGNTTDPGAGNLRFNTTGSNGIYFGSSTQLNDYETGTWTPTLNFGGASTGITYTVHQGTYTKIGRMVIIQCGIYLSSKGSATGGATITGLPYTAISAPFGDNSFIVAGIGNFLLITSCVVGYVNANSTIATLNQQDGTTQLTDSNFSNTTYFGFTATYQAQ